MLSAWKRDTTSIHSIICWQSTLRHNCLLHPPEKWLEVLHACVVALLQLVLVSLLVLLDKLPVPFQGVSWLLQKVLRVKRCSRSAKQNNYWKYLLYLEAEPEFVFMFAWHFALKELLQENPRDLDWTLKNLWHKSFSENEQERAESPPDWLWFQCSPAAPSGESLGRSTWWQNPASPPDPKQMQKMTFRH